MVRDTVASPYRTTVHVLIISTHRFQATSQLEQTEAGLNTCWMGHFKELIDKTHVGQSESQEAARSQVTNVILNLLVINIHQPRAGRGICVCCQEDTWEGLGSLYWFELRSGESKPARFFLKHWVRPRAARLAVQLSVFPNEFCIIDHFVSWARSEACSRLEGPRGAGS